MKRHNIRWYTAVLACLITVLVCYLALSPTDPVIASKVRSIHYRVLRGIGVIPKRPPSVRMVISRSHAADHATREVFDQNEPLTTVPDANQNPDPE